MKLVIDTNVLLPHTSVDQIFYCCKLVLHQLWFQLLILT